MDLHLNVKGREEAIEAQFDPLHIEQRVQHSTHLTQHSSKSHHKCAVSREKRCDNTRRASILSFITSGFECALLRGTHCNIAYLHPPSAHANPIPATLVQSSHPPWSPNQLSPSRRHYIPTSWATRGTRSRRRLRGAPRQDAPQATLAPTPARRTRRPARDTTLPHRATSAARATAT